MAVRAGVHVAEVHDGAVAEAAFDDRTGNCSHGAGVGRVGLVEIPRIDLAIVGGGPVCRVTAKDQRVPAERPVHCDIRPHGTRDGRCQSDELGAFPVICCRV
jgi:hypothetical protein